MIRYKDFETGRKRFTRGSPCGVVRDGLGIERLVVFRKSDELYIPLYCLDVEGRKIAKQFLKNRAIREGREAADEARDEQDSQSGEE